jgi:ABC-2 type transport system permease protein
MNRTVLGFFRKELVQTLRDKRMRLLLFVAPVVQMTLFGLALTNEIRNVKLAFFASPSDVTARRVYERCLASGYFIPAPVRGVDPNEWIRSGDADVVLVAPPGGLSRALERGGMGLQALVDASNVLKARAVEQYVGAALARIASERALDRPRPPPTGVALDVRVLYNPEMRAAVFMVPSVLGMILCLITIVLTAMAMVREKEMGTFETLVASPAKPWEILMGKTLPYVLLGMLDVPLVLAVAVFGFGVPMRGSFLALFISSLLFVVSAVSIGILISTIAHRQQQAMMGSFLFLFPALMLSGIMFPVENMPAVLRVTAYLDPLKYFVSLMRNIMLKGGDWEMLAGNWAALAVMGFVAVWVSFKRFRKTID